MAMASEDAALSIEEMEEKHLARQNQCKVESLSYNRREFLKSSLGAAALSGLWLSMTKETKASPTAPRITIVGGGIAGLNAAYQLQKKGFLATIYEGSTSNSWGRIQTRYADNDLTAELGGEFIDSGHADMLQLAKELNLPLIDLKADIKNNNLIKDSYYFGNRHRSERDVINKFRMIAGKIKADANSLPDSIDYKASLAPKVKELDNTSLEEYLTINLGLHGDWLYDLLTVAYTSEFGLDIGHQSSLNFLTMISTDVSKGFEIFGESDERYKIKGGNSKLIEALVKKLHRQIERGKKLTAIEQNDKKFTLTFSGDTKVSTDFLILALPFKTLRDVHLSGVNLPPKKQKAISELGYGTNSKLLLDVSSRIWRWQVPKRSGYLFSEKVHNGWDNSQGQHMNRGEGGYTVFLGGEAGKNLNDEKANIYLDNLEGAFNGFSNVHKATHSVNWSEHEFSKGSYSCYKRGQWTDFSGAEFEPVGNLYFCGEHCSKDYQGYMNGGAETGGRVAIAILRKLSGRNKRAFQKA